MVKFEATSICILGRQPALGLAELESLYGAKRVEPIEGAALLDVEAADINFKRLGGTLKVAKILTLLPYTDWNSLIDHLKQNVPKHLNHLSKGKFRLGLSVYGLNVPPKQINYNLLAIKKIIRQSGRSVRVVPNKTAILNTAQVLHNKLTHLGGWELLLIKNGQQTILAQTLFVQNIEAYAARDQARPKRDARVGMLPPKLAQILINLAMGKFESSVASHQSSVKKLATSDSRPMTKRALRVLDPFCGTGVILQEALLMGYSVMGTDIEQRMIDYSTVNIKWLIDKYPQIEGFVVIEKSDATTYKWPPFSAVTSEVFLGRPLASLPDEANLKKIINDANTIIKIFLKNIVTQLQPRQRMILAVPAWRVKNGFKHLPLVDHLTEMGYTRLDLVHAKRDELIYFRENQIVAREILTLEKA
ncbi:hypothetical protein A3F65_00260 [Candidatus Saccharibacteria bacterium RIFCSPHIGHO2_12_FULL_47_16b]|nr:MAG: hypothetical protein A3F65_00260 [Candidatus Saccharibacteria bacterium RIFCSPHIGHO2_12_FULL_47_16b]